MQTQTEKLLSYLHPEDGQGVRDFKLYPGTERDASADEIAGEVLAVIERINRGEYEIVPEDGLVEG